MVLAFISFCNISFGQGKIEGRVFSSSSKETLVGATIKLTTKDSTHKYSMLTDSTGHFGFTNVPAGEYYLSVKALSFELNNKPVKLTRTKTSATFDSLFAQPAYDALDGVTVVSKRPAVTVKTDTTTFSASAFKVRKNGTVEDLFKKVPGMEVDRTSGAVKAQGETVTQIYVDGKPFFGTDFKSITQNFPADVIDKIEIIDKKSDQAIASKVEDGIREKIINITLKKNSKKGMFGRDYIGGGTDGRYEAGVNTNFFNNDKKLAIVAGANNTGRSDNSNSSDASYNNWNGITDKKQVKANYANKIGTTFDYSTWAGYEHVRTDKQQDIHRQNIYTDSSSYYAESNHSVAKSDNTYAGLYFEYKPDTLTWVKFNESVGYSWYKSASGAVFNTTLPDSYLLNNGDRENTYSSRTPNANGQVSFSRRFKSRRSFFLNFNNNINASPSQQYNISNNYFFPKNANDYSLLVNQHQDNRNQSSNIGASASYNEPMSKNSYLNASYNYNYGKSNNLRNVYNFDSTTYAYDQYSDSLSSHYNNSTYNTAAALNFTYNGKTSGFGVGARYLTSYVQSLPAGKDSTYSKSYTGFAPNVSFYANGKNKRFNLYYNFNLQAPNANQLQPIIDNTNPLYLRLGNPNLKYASVHNFRYNYNFYDSKKETGFNSNASFSAIVDNIGTSNISDIATGKQISQPVNLDGAYNWNAWFSYFRPIFLGKDKIKWNINLYANGGKSVNLLNGDQNISQNNYAKVYLGFTYDAPSWIDLHTDFSVSRQQTDYSLQPDLNNVAYNLDISPNVTFIPTSKTEINIDYDYRQTTGQAAGYNTSINMLNADVVQYFTNKKDVWVKLKAYDLLNQNVSVWRSTGDNYIQDTKANVLSRFILLSLNFRLNKFNSSKKMDSLDFPEGQNNSSSL